MKKRFVLAILGIVCAISLAACQCKHDWVEANCTTAKTCSKCKETIGEPLGHAWLSATCTEPKTCSACGRKEGIVAGHQWVYDSCTSPRRCRICSEISDTVLGHTWVSTVNTRGIEGRICTACQETELDTYNWTPLTGCEKGKFSNEEAHFADVKIDDWDSRAGKLPDSIRFCVANKESYKNTHYCNYKLKGNYDWISGLISFSDKSDKHATAKIHIYLDNELAYESDTISALGNDEFFKLDVRGVKTVRIVCSTTETHKAYCVVSASVY